MGMALMWNIIAILLAIFAAGLIVWHRVTGGRAGTSEDDEDDEEDRKVKPQPAASPEDRGSRAKSDDKSARIRTDRLSPEPAVSTPPLTPQEQAEQTERKFRKALAAEAVDLPPSALLRTLAESAAQAWLALEDHKRAADVYRDARIHDKALKLYVNKLKDYPTAARVASSKGDHVRAAQLHTYLGDKESALQSWVAWGRNAPNPLLHVKEMRAFGEEQFGNVLVGIIETRPVGETDFELLYRLGGALDAGGFPKAALRVFARLMEVAPGYKDVAALRSQLEEDVAAATRPSSPLPADETGDFEVVTLPAAPTSAVANDSEPPHALLDLPYIDDDTPETEAAQAEAPAAPPPPDASQTESLVKTALATLALVQTTRRVRKGAVEEQAAPRASHDDR